MDNRKNNRKLAAILSHRKNFKLSQKKSHLLTVFYSASHRTFLALQISHKVIDASAIQLLQSFNSQKLIFGLKSFQLLR